MSSARPSSLKRTVFFDRHLALGARMVDFAGWEMPLQYPAGPVGEHLATRKQAGLFDVSHMGRFLIRGPGALEYLQYVLTNNAMALDLRPRGAQYTLIPNETGGAIDDAYLYRYQEGEYLLVVNAANRTKDWAHLSLFLDRFEGVELLDRTEGMVMLALQGPLSRSILGEVVQSGRLPEPSRNTVSTVVLSGRRVFVGRTGYTGEPLCFELFMEPEDGPAVWDALVEKGAVPVGLGARDTLRLEAGLPLYGHELGEDLEGREIPILAVPIARFAVSFSPLKGEFIGRRALARQREALARILSRDYSSLEVLPRMVRPIVLTGRGVARRGARISKDGRPIGYVTSGTMVPYWVFDQRGLIAKQTDEHMLRALCLGYIDSSVLEGETVHVEIRGKEVEAVVVPFHLRSEAPPYARPIVYNREVPLRQYDERSSAAKARRLVEKTVENHLWRQHQCINLIPSEMTLSPLVRHLEIMDPSFRYAEHGESKAFYDSHIFYYQGTEFISEVEWLLEEEMRAFLGCSEVECRLISGQMANTVVYGAVMDYLNRHDPRQEPRRIRRIVHHSLGKGGHLSAQPMGALKDFVARDPYTERPAALTFPVLEENPYQIDVPATLKLIDAYRPELIIFGKSMVLHREPIAEIRAFLDSQRIDTLLMYDAAHVLGLLGPRFQRPFEEGADVITGSTHKTYFGTQRGLAACNWQSHEERYGLWRALRRRTFPGSVSNHHLGTLLALLMAAYEMNHFKDEYQSKVISNAKAFARALKDVGLDVAGDPRIGYTETHQVLLRVGYGRGPHLAARLEANNIICNYQQSPDEEGFTASGALRMGVAEMTRFGMEEEDFQRVAELIRDVIIGDMDVRSEVEKLRSRSLRLRFCFSGPDYEDLVEKLHRFLM
jgi:aminomethyltransferase